MVRFSLVIDSHSERRQAKAGIHDARDAQYIPVYNNVYFGRH